MKQLSAFLFFLISLLFGNVKAQQSIDDKWNAEINTLGNQLKGAWDGVAGFAKGMVQSVGYVGSEYHYSFRAWNDSAETVYLALQDAVPIMGADFYGTVKKENFMELKPLQNTGDHFYNKQLYFIVWLLSGGGKTDQSYYTKSVQTGEIIGGTVGAIFGVGVASAITGPLGAAIGGIIGGAVTYGTLSQFSILERIIYPWAADDPYTYHYRAYSDKGTLKAEYLDIKGTTSEFLGTFFNSSNAADVTLTFSKDNASYTVTLEPQSFSLLQSSVAVPYSIRPKDGEARAFIFKRGAQIIAFMPIIPQGLANVVCDDKSKQCTPIAPMNYTYEVFEKNGTYSAGMQGLAIGNYDQPINGAVRDINPLECHFWYESAEQSAKIKLAQQKDKKLDYDAIAFDALETLWLYYKTKDYSFIKKVMPGSVVNFSLIRPQLSEQQAWLYGVLLNSDDEKKARQFLDRLSSGKIAQQAFKPVISQDLEAGIVLSPNINGIIEDKGDGGSGLIGYVVLGDRFTPRGIGFDTFYYYLEPTELQIDQYVSNILFDNKFYIKNDAGVITLSDIIMQELATNIPQWIRNYPKNKQQVEQAITKYLIEKSRPELIDQKTKQFSDFGKLFYTMFMTGPISIVNPPIIRKAGVNYYTFALGAKPDNWPTS